MKKQIYLSLFTMFLYLTVCLLTSMIFKPISIILLLGVSAGISSVVIILWGRLQIIPLVLSSIILHTLLYYSFSIEFEASIPLIFTLASCAQGLWAKKLTDKLVTNTQWLDSRKKLSSFIYKVGPLASLISAFSCILITILSAQSFDVNWFYVFCQTWSLSVLVSIFGIPILLFVNTGNNVNKGKKLFVIISSIIGGLSIALLFKIGQDQNQHYRNDDFFKVQSNIEVKLEQELQQIEQQLNSLKAYFEASRLVNVESFYEFSAYILNERSKIESFEWAPFVEDVHRSTYERYMSEVLDIHYVISQQTIMGNNIKSKKSDLYLPVQYVFPRYQNEQILSVDLFSHLDKKNAITQAITTGRASATLPINLIEGDFSNPVILVALPVFNHNLKPLFGQYKQQGSLPVSGIVIAVVRVSSFFQNMMNYVDEENINLIISDVDKGNNFTIIGGKLDSPERLSIRKTMNVFSREWAFELSEKNTWLLQNKSWQNWATLLGGTFGGIVFQLLILMMAAYSTELSNRVTQKTRELIISKEKSDKENQAKTGFLQSLSVELRTPLSVIKRLIEVFPQNNLPEKEKAYINNISSAALNLEQLVDTLNELSSIESGRLTLNIQSFDFISFLRRMDEVVEAKTKDIKFMIQEDVPQFIESDELRLQQVFIACTENAKEILDSKNICVSVKVHFHHKNNATIVFVLHVLKTNQFINQADMKLDITPVNKKFNLRMEMAKELCNKLGGDINLAQLPSGESMIHASVKVKISQEQELGLGRFNVPSIEDIAVLDVKRILFIEGQNKQNKNLYRQLLSLKHYVDVISDMNQIEETLLLKKYHLIIFDCSEGTRDIKTIPTPLKGQFSNIPTLALLNDILEDNMLSLVNYKFTAYVVLPITTENLRSLIHSYFK
ncbi:CHASE domain-containing protein [Pseudocolwellia sp. AS88]|uniref:CHASE domain-containing protein n=1 Tax=Pseudocolwellia TaxID=2848177 RepID=UPI0026F30B7F|nr:CHASE domain-containing protein [Pseudocolwellia sp. AS88]MDO7085859.1 CHASE domain-containing protein [Pseudocolwellia sp. AS88]